MVSAIFLCVVDRPRDSRGNHSDTRIPSTSGPRARKGCMNPTPYTTGVGGTPCPKLENPNPEFYEAISTIYDRLYEEVDAAEAVRQWLSLISKFRPLPENGCLPLPKLLDLGCGPGRYLEPWATAGFCVMGVDASKGMIREARRRMANLSNPSRVSLFCHDLRRPSADLIRCSPFDIAVAHFNFLNLFPLKEVQDILHQLRLYLPPDPALSRIAPHPA